MGGTDRTEKDDIGAAPHSAPLIGARYDLTIGGLAQFFVRAMRVSSERTAFNPLGISPDSQKLGKVSDPLVMGDLGFALDLTGQKSWHNLIPTIGFAIGVANASNGVAEEIRTYFGTQFSISSDLGLRYELGKTYELRIDAGNTLYQNHYPSESISCRPRTGRRYACGSNVSKSSYLNSWMLMAGLSVPIFR